MKAIGMNAQWLYQIKMVLEDRRAGYDSCSITQQADAFALSLSNLHSTVSHNHNENLYIHWYQFSGDTFFLRIREIVFI